MEKRALSMLIAFILFTELASHRLALSEPTLPPIDSNLVIVGLSNSATLLNSGNGKIKIYASEYFKDKVKSGIGKDGVAFQNFFERLFAFNGEKSYSRVLFGSAKGTELIFDGRVTVTTREIEPSFITVEQGWSLPNLFDPRDWGLWYQRESLSDYLAKQKNVKVVGTESLNGVPCYLVQAPNSSIENATDKFWIAAERGFRCVRIQYEAIAIKKVKPVRYVFDTTIEYQELLISNEYSAWFPKRGILIRRNKSDGKQLGKNIMDVTDFELNIDVSNLFDIQISPETLVWDLTTRMRLPFKKLGWAP